MMNLCFLGDLTFSGLTFWITPCWIVVVAGSAAMAPSGNAALIDSAAMVFMSVDVFIVSSFRAPLIGHRPACAFSFARAKPGVGR